METKRKRGPRPSGKEMVVFYARVEKSWYLLFETLLEKLKNGDTRVVSYSEVKVPVGEAKPLESAGTAYGGPSLRELLDDIGRLSSKVESLEDDLEQARSLDLEGKALFWRNECLKLKAQSGGDFSQ